MNAQGALAIASCDMDRGEFQVWVPKPLEDYLAVVKV